MTKSLSEGENNQGWGAVRGRREGASPRDWPHPVFHLTVTCLPLFSSLDDLPSQSQRRGHPRQGQQMFGHLVSSSPPSSWAHNSLPDHPPQGEDAPPAVISNASSSNDVPSSPSPLAATPTTQRQQRASDEDQDQDDVLVALEREGESVVRWPV